MPGRTDTSIPSTPSHAAPGPKLASPSVTTRPTRDDSLDIAKGIGILLVVLGHCFDGLNFSGFFPPSILWPTLVVFVIYFFHMPLFFVVSGHLASGKHRPAGQTLARLLTSIVYPYFFWSILQGLVQVYLTKYTSSHVSISALYRILWYPIVPYWFLYALFCCQVGYLAIRRLSHPVQLAIASVLFLIVQLFLASNFVAHLNIIPETARGFLFFVLGVVSVAQVKQFGGKTAIAATVLFALFATIFYFVPWAAQHGDAAGLPAAIAGVIATVAWSRLLAKHSNRLTATLAFWGRYSMSIYVMHIFFTAGVRIALRRLFVTHAVPGAAPTAIAVLTEILAATSLGIAMPLAINKLVSRFNLDKWFGLQHMQAS